MMGARVEKLYISGWICSLGEVSFQEPELELLLCCICVVVNDISARVPF